MSTVITPPGPSGHAGRQASRSNVAVPGHSEPVRSQRQQQHFQPPPSNPRSHPHSPRHSPPPRSSQGLELNSTEGAIPPDWQPGLFHGQYVSMLGPLGQASTTRSNSAVPGHSASAQRQQQDSEPPPSPPSNQRSHPPSPRHSSPRSSQGPEMNSMEGVISVGREPGLFHGQYVSMPPLHSPDAHTNHHDGSHMPGGYGGYETEEQELAKEAYRGDQADIRVGWDADGDADDEEDNDNDNDDDDDEEKEEEELKEEENDQVHQSGDDCLIPY
ncbi:hypothetical protein Hypma_009372 [Hypsizygus marmoreus]|uniref:Uncharacterized protein n=1 Tax=Hypsizygus marmoreus TaxID=39966 RepID=A0A369JML4_HYPMA|nr:hypothetical protein Hypma_009372 [Hypsizygus marmoreus]